MSREQFRDTFLPLNIVDDGRVYYWYISDGKWKVVEEGKVEEYRVPYERYDLKAVTRGSDELLYYSDVVGLGTSLYTMPRASYALLYNHDLDEGGSSWDVEHTDNDGDTVKRRFKSGLVVSYNTPDEYFGPMNKYEQHLYTMLDIHELYYTKNKDYGDAFTQSLDKHGPIAALVRMEDKWNRLSNLMSNGKEGYIKSESVEDTLIDLANYAIMTALYLRGNTTDD